MDDQQRRLKRKEIGYLQNESVWLQKALFALRKAEAAREKLTDFRDAESAPYTIPVDGKEVVVEALEDSLEERVEELIKTVRQMRRNLY